MGFLEQVYHGRIYRVCLHKRLASGSRDDEVYTELLNAVKFNDVVQIHKEKAA